MSNLQDEIERERAQARAACDLSGATSGECAAAWDAVEELQAEAAHQKGISSFTLNYLKMTLVELARVRNNILNFW